jgi:hypothetical protein
MRIGNLPLESSRALGAQGVRQVGQAILRISDPKICLRTLEGLSVHIVKGKEQGSWQLRGASIVGVITQAGQLPSRDRSYLISPAYYKVINFVLATMTFDPKYEKVLTARIMGFLTKLIKHDYKFAGLILGTIELGKFISVNLDTNDQAHIQASVEFLRCFQAEGAFVRDLYEILISIVENELPHRVPPQRGYEALIGLLNWVMPLDVERTLGVLLNTFYSKVCKQCMPLVQTPEYVDFRTRYATLLAGDPSAGADLAEHFPFDSVLLRPLSAEERPQQAANGTATKKVYCPKGHEMEYREKSQSGVSNSCNGGCGAKRIKPFYRCDACDFDMCLACYTAKVSDEPDAAALAASKVGLVRDLVVRRERQAMS